MTGEKGRHGDDPRGAEKYMLLLRLICPEVTGIATAILAGPDANICLILLVGRSLTRHMGTNIVVVSF